MSLLFSPETRLAPLAWPAHGIAALRSRDPQECSGGLCSPSHATAQGAANGPIQLQTPNRIGTQLPSQPPSPSPIWFCIGDLFFFSPKRKYVEFSFPLFGIFVANGTSAQSSVPFWCSDAFICLACRALAKFGALGHI